MFRIAGESVADGECEVEVEEGEKGDARGACVAPVMGIQVLSWHRLS